jgi:transcriptional regulator with XRE-family HTH domain
MITTNMPEKVHQGRAVKRIREILQVKQETLAAEIGISQQSVSLLEGKETIDPETLEKIAEVLKVPVDAIKNFDDTAAVNFIASTFHDNASIVNTNCTLNINPVEKWLEAMDEIKKLNTALIKEKDEKIALLEKMLDERKKK